jgi:N-acetylmuramoyl-L-alanine amidase
MVEACYKAVKSVNADFEFGIAPFGIWKNNDGTNNGSDTKGLSSYDAIYCDSLAWIRGGYIDFIAPQIYWTFSNSSARFDVLVRWWNAVLDGVDDIDLIICHAMYRSAEWNVTNEIKNQIEFARSERSYKGSILYGYAALKRDDMNLKEQLQTVFKTDYDYNYKTAASVAAMSNGTASPAEPNKFMVSSPKNNSYINYETTYIIGMSDPDTPLLFEGKNVSRTRNGYFSLYVNLAKGKNAFTFNYGGEDIAYTVNRGYEPAGAATYAALTEFVIKGIKPSSNIIASAGTTIDLAVTAPAYATVTATIRNASVTLKPTVNPPDKAPSGGYMSETYTGTFAIPDWAAENEIASLGNITYTVVLKGGTEEKTATGANVRIAGKNAYVNIEVISDDTELKVSETSWYYDDFVPASKGMRDRAVSLMNGYYKLRMGGYIDADGVREIDKKLIIPSKSEITNAYMDSNEKETLVYIKTGVNVPVNGYVDGDKFILDLYNVDPSTGVKIKFADNPLFSKTDNSPYTTLNAYNYTLYLKDINNFYGYEFSYSDGYLIAKFKNPQTIADTNQPLKGKVIVVDAGHGGTDTGALGPDSSYNEADMNLDIAETARKALEKLGATVVMTRIEDKAVDIYDRLDMLINIKPDLVISIHQNSMNYNSDITRIRGLMGIYYSNAGLLLADSISNALAAELNRMEREVAQQRLAMLRNQKFPATLVEVGFITCVEEYDLMRRDNLITRAGNAIAAGVIDYYKAQEAFM